MKKHKHKIIIISALLVMSLSTWVVATTDREEDSYPAYQQQDTALINVDEETSLRERLFMGEGVRVSRNYQDRLSVDALDWYSQVFGGIGFNSIPGHIIDMVGSDIFHEWTQQFQSHNRPYGWRNRREANLRTFIEDFNISKEEIIRAEELLTGIPIDEIEELVTWARSVDMFALPFEERLKAANWLNQRSLSDINALFSNDVYEIWAAFPGAGVIQNGKVYSPEWILNNMYVAIHVEEIPLYEIVRVINASMEFHSGYLSRVVSSAITTFQAEVNFILQEVASLKSE